MIYSESTTSQIMSSSLKNLADMPQERPWWSDKKYREEANGSCDSDECWHEWHDLEAIVAEATRRGIEQGKREAWEEMDGHCKYLDLTEDSYKRSWEQVRDLASDRLSSLSQSSNEKV